MKIVNQLKEPLQKNLAQSSNRLKYKNQSLHSPTGAFERGNRKQTAQYEQEKSALSAPAPDLSIYLLADLKTIYTGMILSTNGQVMSKTKA